MSVYDRERLEEQLLEASEDLSECYQTFERWIQKTKSGQSAWAEFSALSIGAQPLVFSEMDSERLEILFQFVLSQTKHSEAWTEYYVQSGLEAQEGAHGDYLYEQERGAELD